MTRCSLCPCFWIALFSVTKLKAIVVYTACGRTAHTPHDSPVRGCFVSLHVRCERWPSCNPQCLKAMHYFACSCFSTLYTFLHEWSETLTNRSRYRDRRTRFPSTLHLTDDVLSYEDFRAHRLWSSPRSSPSSLLCERHGSFCFCTRLDFIQWISWLSCVAHTKCHSLTSHWPWGITVQ